MGNRNPLKLGDVFTIVDAGWKPHYPTKPTWGLTVVEYVDAHNVICRSELGTEFTAQASHIRNSNIRDIMRASVYGHGVNDMVGVARPKSYATWSGMLERCYCPKSQIKKPTYIGCTVCEEWLTLSVFNDWFNDNYTDGYQLDKDLIDHTNKEYSPDTCLFVPSQLNSLLINCGSSRGKLPQGVCLKRFTKKYQSQFHINGRTKHLGYFTSIVSATQAYTNAKYEHVKVKLQQYVKDNVITQNQSIRILESCRVQLSEAMDHAIELELDNSLA